MSAEPAADIIQFEFETRKGITLIESYGVASNVGQEPSTPLSNRESFGLVFTESDTDYYGYWYGSPERLPMGMPVRPLRIVNLGALLRDGVGAVYSGALYYPESSRPVLPKIGDRRISTFGACAPITRILFRIDPPETAPATSNRATSPDILLSSLIMDFRPSFGRVLSRRRPYRRDVASKLQMYKKYTD